MVEYLIRLFHPQYKVATLSRGYGRKTKGFRLASSQENALTIGDEPFQLFKKFGSKIHVAVGEERAMAIPAILDEFPEVQVILLDDAFQHRRVNPTFQIVLTDFNRPFFNDFLMPVGRLRESRGGVSRADAIVVTKCPSDLSDDKMMEIEKSIRDYTDKPVFFSAIRYGVPIAIAENASLDRKVVLVTGIANAEAFQIYCRSHWDVLRHFDFPDHHRYSPENIRHLIEEAKNANAAIITTEKDSVKLENFTSAFVSEGICIFYLPIETCFIKNGKDFDEMALNTVSSS